MSRPTFAYLPSSHLDLFWLGNYKTCLERGAEILRQYVERCMAASDETFLVDTVVFAEYFLQRHPELRSAFLQLVREGRLEIGCAYIDRWETLILGESLIRNVQIGKRWCREVLELDNEVVTHPDLPSMTPQIAQIYRAGGAAATTSPRARFSRMGRSGATSPPTARRCWCSTIPAITCLRSWTRAIIPRQSEGRG